MTVAEESEQLSPAASNLTETARGASEALLLVSILTTIIIVTTIIILTTIIIVISITIITIISGGINDGNADGIGLGAQTGFGFSQNSQGGLDATAQLGGNVQVRCSTATTTVTNIQSVISNFIFITSHLKM